jgi:general secretion pathway protein L
MAHLIKYCAGTKDFTTENTMFKVFEEKLQFIINWLKAGPVGLFFRWWIEELRQAMPSAWQQKIQHAMRRVTVVLGDERLTVGVDENRSLKKLEAFPVSQDASLQKEQLDKLLLKNELVDAPQFLLVDLDFVLNKELKLPLAADSNLAQVLTFEMDRQTPFRASDVYFDWKVLERGGESGQLHLELFVAPKTSVDALVSTASNLGYRLTGVDVVDGDRTLGVNLLPVAQRVKRSNPKTRLSLVLGGLSIALLALVMAQSLYLRGHQVTELEEAITGVQGEARQVMQIKKQIADTSEAAGFLARSRAATPLAIEVLADVTRLLPDDTYLDRLVIANSSVQMQGKSQNAQQLIELVNQSPILDDAAFRGSTRLDARSGLEIFEVNAEVLKAGAD